MLCYLFSITQIPWNYTTNKYLLLVLVSPGDLLIVKRLKNTPLRKKSEKHATAVKLKLNDILILKTQHKQQADRLRGVSPNWERQTTFQLVISIGFSGSSHRGWFFPLIHHLNRTVLPNHVTAFCRLLCCEIKTLSRPGIKATTVDPKES